MGSGSGDCHFRERMVEFIQTISATGALLSFLRGRVIRQRYLPNQLMVVLAVFFAVLLQLHLNANEQERAEREQEERVQQQTRQEDLIRRLAVALSVPWNEPGGLDPLPRPSVKAVDLANLIEAGDGPYAQALKATA
jgi:hypothetical protein